MADTWDGPTYASPFHKGHGRLHWGTSNVSYTCAICLCAAWPNVATMECGVCKVLIHEHCAKIGPRVRPCWPPRPCPPPRPYCPPAPCYRPCPPRPCYQPRQCYYYCPPRPYCQPRCVYPVYYYSCRRYC